jgi:hypothetical protein
MNREGKAYTLPSKAWLAELADIADIRPDSLHPDHAEYFYIEVVSLLKEQWRNADRRTSNPAVLDAQKKILAALKAYNKLNEHERECLTQYVYLPNVPDVAKENWNLIFRSMIDALVEMTGEAPGPFREPGANSRWRKHTFRDHPLHQLVESLLYLVAHYGGQLTFDAKNGGSGTLFKALTHLRPVLPSGLVPKALPLKTIERMMTECFAA